MLIGDRAQRGVVRAHAVEDPAEARRNQVPDLKAVKLA